MAYLILFEAFEETSNSWFWVIWIDGGSEYWVDTGIKVGARVFDCCLEDLLSQIGALISRHFVMREN